MLIVQLHESHLGFGRSGTPLAKTPHGPTACKKNKQIIILVDGPTACKKPNRNYPSGKPKTEAVERPNK